MQYLIRLFILIIPGFVFSQVSFEAITDAESVLQNSTFQVTFQLKNAEGSGFSPPSFSPFRVVSGPSRSMQTTIINGAMSSSVGFVYVLTCNQIGSYTIPSAGIVVRGRTIQTKPITIKVVKATATASSGGADVFIKAIVEKQEVYLAEQFILSYKLYTRVNIENIEFASKPDLDAFQEEAVNMLNNTSQREIYEGREYTTKVLSKTALYPVKTGMITIDPAVFRIVKGDNDPFGFGMPSLFRSQVENITCNELKIKVKDLPQPIPEHFSGAVGEMFVQKNPINKTYTLNDAIHLGFQLQGDANFNTIKPDFVLLDSSFEISDSKAADIIKVTDEPRITKTRKYDYLIVPKSPGEYLISPYFVYFNPVQNKYVLIKDSIKVQIIGANNQLATQDQVDIKDIKRSVSLEFNSPTLIRDYRSWMLFGLPIGLLLFSFYKKKAEYFSAKKSKVDRNDLSSFQHLNLDNLEKLLARKILLKYPNVSEESTWVVIKQFLQQKKNEDKVAQNFLNIIQYLDTLKYSGAVSSEQLTQLHELINLV
jgi:hypothetical protein